MDARDEVIVVLLAQAGDRPALDQLFRGHQDGLYTRIHVIVGDAEAAADVLQDVFVVMLRKLRHLRDPRFFRAWAHRIAVREAIRAVKRERRWVMSDLDVDDFAAEGGDPLERVATAEVARHLSSLPDASRVVLMLHYLDGSTLSEIAETLRIPVGTVKSRLSYGLARLRERMRRAAEHTTSSELGASRE